MMFTQSILARVALRRRRGDGRDEGVQFKFYDRRFELSFSLDLPL
jgi:hypothetical protein